MEIHEIAATKLKILKLSQKNVAHELEVSQPQVSQAMNGTNQKILDQVIHLLITKYEVDRREFYPDENERIFALEKRMESLEQTIKELPRIIWNMMQGNEDT